MNKKLRIAQLAPLLESVPPYGYGGIELMVSVLTEQLIDCGHEITLFASGDSRTRARLRSVVDKSLRQNRQIPKHLHTAYDVRSILALEAMQNEFDIVHNHMGWQALPALSKLGIPTLTTNHNLIEDATAPIYLRYASTPYVAISQAYKRLNYGDRLNYVDTIYNGIDLANYNYSADSQRTYLLFLGRICREKGTADAIKLALNLKLPLLIAGKVDDVDKEYYKREVEPALQNPLIKEIGEVNHEQKVALLQNALALVYPIAFAEPFGLVMIEAMACGVPVLALERGSVPEVLIDKQTAIISHNIDELQRRFAEIHQLSRQSCRNRVADLFSAKRMAEKYAAAYRRIITVHRSQNDNFINDSPPLHLEQLHTTNVVPNLTDALIVRPGNENT